jgi:hypothetical protein
MRVAWWGGRWCLLVDRTGITDMVEGWLALSAVVARVALQKGARALSLCDVSRPSLTCPFRVVLGAVVAVAQQICHDRRGYLGDEVPQRGVACSEHADAQSARHGLRV